jgi:uncharacterized protein (TIGR02145 family)
MAENSKVKHYRNGEDIPNIKDNNNWPDLTIGAWCNYDDQYNAVIYGCLSNWYAVNDTRGFAPEGWHVPSYGERQTLIYFMGGVEIAGGKMKETGITYWSSPNTGAANNSGFSALPGGWVDLIHPNIFNDSTMIRCFTQMHEVACFWASTDNFNVWSFSLNCKRSSIQSHRDDSKHTGFSVRCVKDN